MNAEHLFDRLWGVITEVRDAHPRRHDDAPTDDIVTAILPFIAAEVRAAKAEAWREYAAALEAVPDYAPTEYYKGCVDQRHAAIEELYVRATEYETGDRA